MEEFRPIRFPWPLSKLGGNSRTDRRWLTKDRAMARQIGLLLTRDAGWVVEEEDCPLELTIIICPPDKRHRDDDNVYSCFKSYRDGMFQALDIDDSAIRRTILEWADVEKDGALYVSLKGMEK